MKVVLQFAALLLIGALPFEGQRMPMAGPSVGGLGHSPGVSFGQPEVRIGFGGHRFRPEFVASSGILFLFGIDEPTTVVVENVMPSITQQAKPANPVFEERAPEAPLILERQGDRWVRRAPDQYGPVDILRLRDAKPLAPTVLIFRDGKRVEVSRYVIAGNTIYENTEHWTRRIQVADLDLRATLRANQQRGVEFRVPLDQNEIVTRP